MHEIQNLLIEISFPFDIIYIYIYIYIYYWAKKRFDQFEFKRLQETLLDET